MSYETFTFKGINSSTMGVLMSDEWLDSIPGHIYDQIDIPGRDGAIYSETALKDITMDIPCVLRNSARKEALKAWLNGTGLLVINGREKLVHIYDQIDFSRIGFRSEKFSIPLIMEPYWHAAGSDTYETYTVTSGKITVMNEGNTWAAPRFKITPSSATVSLSWDDAYFTIIKENLSGDSIVIDCESKTESDPGAVTGIGYTYPTLPPGETVISVSGSAKIEICRKDRWI